MTRITNTIAITKEKPSVSKPWLKYYSEEALNLELPKCTVLQYLKKVNADRMDAPALQYYGTTITHREFYERVDECANAFAAMGVKAGDMVSMVTVSVPETVYAIYGLNKIGAQANTIDPRMDVNSIKRMVQEANSRLLFTIDIAFPKIKKIIDEINQEYIIVQSPARSLPFVKRIAKTLMDKTKIDYSEKVIKWDVFVKKGVGTVAKEAPYDGDATVAVTYTGGTTGFPKGVLLTNDSMNAVAVNFEHASFHHAPGDRFLGIIPVFSSYGMVCGMHMPLALGFELVLVPKFVPTELGKLIVDFYANHMISTPAFYEMMMNSKEVKGKDLSFLYTIGSGGDTMNEGLEQKLDQFIEDHNMKYPLAQGYGMSELSAAASFCAGDIYRRHSVGVPSLTTTDGIFDPETGEELGIGEEGEICVTGPSMMKGYYNRPEETAHVMRKHDDGQVWIHSGDIGYMDEDGFLYVIGRVKRMITRFDGHKVFPVNIESLVGSHPMVRNCCVFGINDMDHAQGQYPLVAVSLKECHKEAICQELYDVCQMELEERGRPVGVIHMDEIPLTGMSKNDYRLLEKEYANFNYKALGQA